MAYYRTNFNHWARFWVDGYDLSGGTRGFSTLNWEFATETAGAISDTIKTGLPGIPSIDIGSVSAFLDNTATTGFHIIATGGPGVVRSVMIPVGMGAEPAQGDPCFCGEFEQKDYKADTGNIMVSATMTFAGWSTRGDTTAYSIPWGRLLHANAATTAANTAVGIDDYGDHSHYGGYMAYQIFAGNGNAAIKVQDADTNLNGSFGDLSGATTGNIDCSSPSAGIIALGATATVKRYLRWQLALDSATTVTFGLAFVRGFGI